MGGQTRHRPVTLTSSLRLIEMCMAAADLSDFSAYQLHEICRLGASDWCFTFQYDWYVLYRRAYSPI